MDRRLFSNSFFMLFLFFFFFFYDAVTLFSGSIDPIVFLLFNLWVKGFEWYLVVKRLVFAVKILL